MEELDTTIQKIDELIKNLEIGSIKLSQALIRSKTICEECDNDDFSAFIRMELNGDFQDIDIPKYRIIHADPIGVFHNKLNGRVDTQQLQFAPLLEQIGVNPDEAYQRKIGNSIPDIEELISNSFANEVKADLTPSQLSFIKPFSNENDGWELASAYYISDMSSFRQIIISTQAKLIDKLLEVKKSLKQNKKEDTEFIFEKGKHFDALVKFSKLVKEAKDNIVLIDNYIDESTLEFFSDKKPHITLHIITAPKSYNEKLKLFEKKYNKQYQNLNIKTSNSFHDRFLIIDKSKYFHIGASLKDAGNKVFMLTKIEQDSAKKSIQTQYEDNW